MSSPFPVRMSGPLSGFAAGFREELLAGGYPPGLLPSTCSCWRT
jgi:hypothetical protein